MNVSEEADYPDEAYHMVTQLPWEDDIIWNGEDIKQKVCFRNVIHLLLWVAAIVAIVG